MMKKTSLLRFSHMLFVLYYLSCSLFAGDELGLSRTPSPVPFGKLSYVVGYGFENTMPDLRFIKIDDDKPGLPGNSDGLEVYLSKQGKQVKILQNYENILTIELPDVEFGIALLTLNTAREEKKVVILNKPDLQWISTNKAWKGDTVRAMGKGLTDISLYPSRNKKGLPVSYAQFVDANTKVILEDSNNQYHECIVVKSSAYDVHFIIPREVSEGKAKIFLHAGHGGKLGWSEPRELIIKKREEWPSKIFNVMDYGAVGNGMHDETRAVTAAIQDIRKNAGGILYFPAGGYHVNKMFRLPPKTIIRGESRERSWIFLPDGFHTNATDSSVKILFAGEGSVGMENLSIHAVYVDYILMAPVGENVPANWIEFAWEADSGINGADFSFVNNCRLLHNVTHLYHRRKDDPRINYFKRDQSVNVLLRGDNIEVTNSEFQGKESNVYLCDSKYSKIANNLMHQGNSGNNIGLQHGSTGYEKIIIENNTLDGIAPTNHGSVWMMHGGKNLHLVNNNVLRQFWVSDNEGLLGHMWGYRVPLFIKKTGGNEVVVDLKKWEAYWLKMEQEVGDLSKYFPFNKQNTGMNDFSIYKGKEVQVFRGKGLGEVNHIENVDGNHISFEEEFCTPITEESYLVIHEAPAFRNIVFAGNKIQDTGQAIFLWGHSHEITIDGNIAVRTGPIGAWTVFHAFSVAGGCHFFQIINNYCSEGKYHIPGQHSPGGRYSAGGIAAHYSCESNWASGGGALNYVGYLIRNNYLENDCSFSYTGYDNTWCNPLLEKSGEREKTPYDFVGMTFEDNTSKDNKFGMVFGSSIKAVIKNNEFINVENELVKNGNNTIVEIK